MLVDYANARHEHGYAYHVQVRFTLEWNSDKVLKVDCFRYEPMFYRCPDLPKMSEDKEFRAINDFVNKMLGQGLKPEYIGMVLRRMSNYEKTKDITEQHTEDVLAFGTTLTNFKELYEKWEREYTEFYS